MFPQWRWMLKRIPTALGITFILQGNLSGVKPLALAQTTTKELETSLSNQTEVKPRELETVSKEEALGIVRYRPQLKRLNQQPQKTPLSQITDVSRLQDLEPNQWAYEALRSLGERYGCIEGYPDQTFRGNQTLSRWQFAAALNSCLNAMQKPLQETVAVLREDMEKLKRLSREFETELASFGTRISNLEARMAYLEDHQFSTTTKLSATAIFSGVTYASGEGQRETVYQNNNYLGLTTSFTGRDLLSTGLVSSTVNIPELSPLNNGRNVGPTREGFTTWAYGGATNSSLFLINLDYIFPILDAEDQWYVTITPYNGFNTMRYLVPRGTLGWEGYEAGDGPLSAFGQRSPQYRLGGGGGFLTSYYTGPWRISGGYLASQSFDPSRGRGLFNGDYVALGQIDLALNDNFALAVAYFHNYFTPGQFAFNSQYKFNADSPGYLGTALANRFDNAGLFVDENVPVTSNSYGIQAFYQINPNLIVGGFGTKIDARLIGRGDADIWSYALNLAFPDLGQEGNLGGVILGVEPTLRGIKGAGILTRDFKRDTSWHIEAFYRHQLNDNVSITPGFIWITAPNQDTNNQDIFLALFRTTHRF